MKYKKDDLIYVLPNNVYAPEGLAIIIKYREDSYEDMIIHYRRRDGYPDIEFRVYPEFVVLAKDLTTLEKIIYDIPLSD